MFTKSDFERLAAVQASPAISIYIATHRAGQKTHDGHDAIVWSNAVKEVRHHLEASGMPGGNQSGGDIEKLLAPLTALEKDVTFWTRQSDTLAAFLYDGELELFPLPVKSEETRTYVQDQLVLSPAAGMLAPDARYYVFTLSRGGNAFYEATRHSITPVYIHDAVPEDMAEVLEPYVGGEHLSAHTAGASAGAGSLGGTSTVFGGQGSNEDRIDEQERIYYERVTAGLDKLLGGQHEPLIIVAPAQHTTEFKRTLHYPNVVEESIDINPDNLSPAELHTETWQRMQPRFDKTYASLSEKVDTATGAGRFVATAQDAVPAAINGQVDTLFVASDMPTVYGTYDEATNSVTYRDADAGGQDLVELAIRKTVENGGQVFSRASFTLPDSVESVGAVLRYAV